MSLHPLGGAEHITTFFPNPRQLCCVHTTICILFPFLSAAVCILPFNGNNKYVTSKSDSKVFELSVKF